MTERMTACPLCGSLIPLWERYPRMLCGPCGGRAVDRNGNPVKLRNTTLLGSGLELVAGAVRLFDIEAEEFPIFVDGIECRGREHRFGGVFVQIV